MNSVQGKREHESDGEDNERDNDVELIKRACFQAPDHVPSTELPRQDTGIKIPVAPHAIRDAPTIGKVYGCIDDAEKRIKMWHKQAYPDGRTLMLRSGGSMIGKVRHPVFTCRESESRSGRGDITAKCGLRITLKAVEDVDAHVVASANSNHSDACNARAAIPGNASPQSSLKPTKRCHSRGRNASPENATASGLPERADQNVCQLFGDLASLEVGQTYRGTQETLVKDFMTWHKQVYPEHSISSNPYRKSDGLLNGYFKCKNKAVGICNFRIIFDPLPDKKRFEITMSDSQHSEACRKRCMTSSRSDGPVKRRKLHEPALDRRNNLYAPHRNNEFGRDSDSELSEVSSSDEDNSDSTVDEPPRTKSISLTSLPTPSKTIATDKLNTEAPTSRPVASPIASGSCSMQAQPNINKKDPPTIKWVQIQQPLAILAPYVLGRFVLHGITTTTHLLEAGIETREDFAEAIRQVSKLEPQTQGSVAEIATYFALRKYL